MWILSLVVVISERTVLSSSLLVNLCDALDIGSDTNSLYSQGRRSVRGKTHKYNALWQLFNRDKRSQRETSCRSWRPWRKDKSEVHERGGEGLPDRKAACTGAGARDDQDHRVWWLGLRFESGVWQGGVYQRTDCHAEQVEVHPVDHGGQKVHILILVSGQAGLGELRQS